jgi:serine phosphatase RsbU (regulator of sigma subunit)
VRTLKAYQGSETQNDDLTLIGFKIWIVFCSLLTL